MGNLTDREHEELLMLYRQTKDEIDRTKREQWRHYCATLVAQAGVTGLAVIAFSQPDVYADQVVYTVLTGLLVIGLTLFVLHQLRLARLGKALDRWLERLEPQTQHLLVTMPSERVYRIGIPILMAVAMVLLFSLFAFVALPGSEEEQTPSVPTMQS